MAEFFITPLHAVIETRKLNMRSRLQSSRMRLLQECVGAIIIGELEVDFKFTCPLCFIITAAYCRQLFSDSCIFRQHLLAQP